MSAGHDRKRIDALMAALAPVMRAVVAEHLTPPPVQRVTLPAVTAADHEVADDVTRARARAILARAGLRRGRP